METPVALPSPETGPPGRALAVAAEGLYLANLMLIPGLGFAVLALLGAAQWRRAPRLARIHLRQTLAASLWAGGLLAALAAVVWVRGADTPGTWVLVLPLFTLGHSGLILVGAVGLVKAMAGEPYRFPLIGPAHDPR